MGRSRNRAPYKEQDDWFIPYKPVLNGMIPHSGIGYSPAPVRQNSQRFFSAFSSSSNSAELDRNFTFPARPGHGLPSRPSQVGSRHVPKSPSHGWVTEKEMDIAAMPSSTSVPTGLSAPTMLFSPLVREMRSGSSSGIRQRTFSLPGPAPKAKNNPYEPRDMPRRWVGSSMCDMLFFPRPRISPLDITPPPSPSPPEPIVEIDHKRVVADGQARVQEREEWADLVKRRGRSLSYGSQNAPADAPIIGNVRARSRERERPARSRASSFGSLFSRGSLSRNGSLSRRESASRRGSASRRSSRPDIHHENSSNSVKKSFGFVRRSSVRTVGRPSLEDDPFQRHTAYHGHSTSNPELLNTIAAPRSRTVRLQRPPNRDGVVVIGPDTNGYRTAPRTPSYDFSKPLPDLPPINISRDFATLQQNSSSDQIGVAISPDPSITDHPVPSRLHPLEPPVDHSSANARAFLAKQHHRAQTRKAFQTPVQSPMHRRDPSLISQPQSTPSSAMFPISSMSSSTSTSSNTPRKQTAMEEAIGRSRAASVGAVDHSDVPSSRTFLRTRPRTAESDDTVLAPPPRPSSRLASPPLVYPIATDPPHRSSEYDDVFALSIAKAEAKKELARNALDSPPRSEKLLRPDLAHADSATSQMTMFTDASEGRSRGVSTPDAPENAHKSNDSLDVPSPETNMDDRDFHGLFFRTPHEQAQSFGSIQRPRNSYPAVPHMRQASQTVGLGYGLEDGHRRRSTEQSDGSVGRPSVEQSDASTDEIRTPVILSNTASPMSSLSRRSRSASLTYGHGSPPRQAVGNQSSPATQDHGTPASLSSTSVVHGEIRFSQVNSGRPGFVPTPPRNATMNNRRSFVPEQSNIDNNASPRLPQLSPGIFGTSLEPPLAFTDTTLAATPPPPTQPSTSIDSASPANKRASSVPSFVQDFPSPPRVLNSASTSTMTDRNLATAEKHASAFGQLVTGPPGAGKTTYCHGMHQFLTALSRPVHIINLDPAVPNPPYSCAINITSLITLESVMEEFGLGPNGGILYCLEYLEANFDWLVEQLDLLLEGEEGGGYVIFDTPGQVELWTNHDSLKKVVERLTRMDYRLAAVHLSDAHYITDASKFISVVLLALRAMMQLEMPHVNVLSKIDLLSTYGELPFDLRYYTECRDLTYLLGSLESDPRSAKFGSLNRAMVELVEDYGMVGFETLAVEDKSSMLNLLRILDEATGYLYIPSSVIGSGGNENNLHALMEAAEGFGDVDDVQERWVDRREEFDEVEEEGWKREGEIRAARVGDSASTGDEEI